MPIHIKMKEFRVYAYCGKIIVENMLYVTQDFTIPNHMMCSICVDEWENEDIRMKTPVKTTKLMDRNEKD